jgi:hypothetical protein
MTITLKWHNEDVTTAITEIVKAGTGTFLVTFKTPHVGWFDPTTLEPYDGPVTSNIEIEQKVELQNCLLTVTSRWRWETIDSGKPNQLETTLSTDKFSLRQVTSVGAYKSDAITRSVYLILKEPSNSSKMILEVDKVPHQVPDRIGIRIYMYAQDFDKIIKEVTSLAKTCGADIIFVEPNMWLGRPG